MRSEDALRYADCLEDNGFVHIQNLLSISSVLQVREYLDKLFESDEIIPDKYLKRYVARQVNDSGNIIEINHCARLESRLVKTTLFRTCKEIASKLLGKPAYRSFDHAIYKASGSGGVLWHQDQAYKKTVKQMRSITVWIPLHDVSVREGCMQYIPLSYANEVVPHKKYVENGGLSVDVPESAPVVTCEASIGDVIIHNPLVLHSSLPNKSDETRKAWILHFGPYGRFEPFLVSNLPHLFKYMIGSR